MSELRGRLQLVDIEAAVRTSRLRWYGHLQRMDNDNCSKKIMDFGIEGAKTRGGQRKQWLHNVKCDMESLGLDASLTQDRVAWRTAIRQKDRHKVCVQPSSLVTSGR